MEAIKEHEAEMPLLILTANTQYTTALIDLQKKKSLLTKRSSKMDIFDATSQEIAKTTNEIAKEVDALEPVEDPEKASQQLVEIKVRNISKLIKMLLENLLGMSGQVSCQIFIYFTFIFSNTGDQKQTPSCRNKTGYRATNSGVVS